MRNVTFANNRPKGDCNVASSEASHVNPSATDAEGIYSSVSDSGNGGNGNDNIPVVAEMPEPAPNPFKLENYRLSLDFSEIGLKQLNIDMPCRKPNKQEFVRVRPGKEWFYKVALVEDQENHECYLVGDELQNELLLEGFMALLRVAVNRNGEAFLWRLKFPGPDGRTNRWNESALAAAEYAETKWVRVVSNMSGGCYNVFEATGINVEPKWPELTLEEMCELCFKDRRIDSLDHPMIKKLRGEV